MDDAPETKSDLKWCRGWRGGLLLLGLTFAAYIPAIVSGGFVWDDQPHILLNKMLYQPDALRRIWLSLEFQQYYPIQLTTYWLELKLFGQNAAVMHFNNVLLHAIAGIFLWRVFLRLKLPYAWWAAAVFLLHPVNVETAAWITERRNVLCATFYFATLLCWLRFDDSRQRRWYAAAMAVFVLALLSKSVACSLPVVILIISWARGKTFREWLGDLGPVVPMFALGLPVGLLTASMERYLIGANGYEWSFSIAERLLVCGRALWFYVANIFFPVNLTFIYPRWQIDTGSLVQWSYFATAVLFILSLIPIGRRFGRKAVAPALCFGAMIFPALGFANIYPQRFSFVADHFQYVASAAAVSFVAILIRWAATRFELHGRPLTAAGTVTLAVFAALSFRHAALFESDERIWDDVLRKNPTAWLAHANIGTGAFNQRQYEKALTHYRQALEHGPRPIDTRVAFQYAEALESSGDVAGARAAYIRAVDESPAFTMVEQRNRPLPLLGRWVRQLAGTPPDFLTIYERHRVTATEDAILALARMDTDGGNIKEATRWIEQAEALRGGTYKTALLRARMALNGGRNEEALEHLERAVTRTTLSAEPQLQRGKLLLQMGRPAEAREAFTLALEREPQHADAHLNLGVLLARAGYFETAREHLQQSIVRDAARADGYSNLARVCLALKDFAAAAKTLHAGAANVKSPQQQLALMNELAWLLATCPDDQVRNAQAAISVAQQSLAVTASVQALDALGAAHADKGAFDKAIEAAERAEKLAGESGNAVLAKNIAARIELYRGKRPFRQE